MLHFVCLVGLEAMDRDDNDAEAGVGLGQVEIGVCVRVVAAVLSAGHMGLGDGPSMLNVVEPG